MPGNSNNYQPRRFGSQGAQAAQGGAASGNRVQDSRAALPAQGAQSSQTAQSSQDPQAFQGTQSTQQRPRRQGFRAHADADKPRKKSWLTLQIEAWGNRLLGAVNDRTLADQEAQYAAGRTKRDYIWNTVGVGAWGLVFPVLTIVATQLVGATQAGMFSLAFVTALLLMFVGNYGIRNFQSSDLEEEYSFSDYQANRVMTCVIMMVVGWLYCQFRAYDGLMFTMSMGIYFYKMIDALADVYEGRLQQMDKLYLAGISQAFRSVAALLFFSFALLITRDLGIASIVMAVVATITLVIFTIPMAMFETPRSRKVNLRAASTLLKQCFPLFVALFMYNLIDNMPKFVMEGALEYDNQLYYNALYFPAHAILLTSGFIYKPMLVRMAAAWADPSKRRRFSITIGVVFAVIVAITLVVAFLMDVVGISILSFLYGLDFEPYRNLCFVMLAAGGVTACIEFLYQVITVLRRQRAVTKLYVITFGFSIMVPMLLINFTGLPGAVIGYLIVMTILLVLLVSEYVSIRLDLHKVLTGKSASDAEMPTAANTSKFSKIGNVARPSEVRADRQHREAVVQKWTEAGQNRQQK